MTFIKLLVQIQRVTLKALQIPGYLLWTGLMVSEFCISICIWSSIVFVLNEYKKGAFWHLLDKFNAISVF